MERHLATIGEAVADLIGDQPCIVQGARRISWGAFDDRASRLAGAFAAAGIGHGSKVAEYLYNAPEYMETYYAAVKIRATPVNVNYRYLDDELLYLLENSEAEALVFHTSLGDRVARIRDRAPGVKLWIAVHDGGGFDDVVGSFAYEDVLAAHEPAPRIARDPSDVVMTYTGGTTGMPKGVMSRMGGGIEGWMTAVPPILGMAPVTDPAEIPAMAKRVADEGRQWVSLPACPLMHGTGMDIGTRPSMCFGGVLVLLEHRGLDVDEVWSTVERESVNGLTIVGDAFARPLLRGLQDGPARELGSLRLLMSAGAMFSGEVKQGLHSHLPNAAIVDYMAATEGGMGVSVSTREKPAATGRFMPGAGVKVLREDGEEVAPGSGEMGIVCVPVSERPLGYFKDEEKTARTFREIGGQLYSVPGDWALVEDDGSITLLGRGSQCINTGGEKVFPEEVEEIIKLHPAVDDALVFGVDDERFGQRVVGVASVTAGGVAGPDEIIELTRTKLSSYKVPRQLVLVEVVPRAPNGKADYPGARSLFEAAAT
ncbi:MAG TPA: AMP-binding protein [Acidimicrobiales bacterium]|nr:AMP-binding protein [Acidimicrobiales bacterium]